MPRFSGAFDMPPTARRIRLPEDTRGLDLPWVLAGMAAGAALSLLVFLGG